MKVHELISLLEQQDKNADVVVLSNDEYRIFDCITEVTQHYVDSRDGIYATRETPPEHILSVVELA